jgi:hypothetical protein
VGELRFEQRNVDYVHIDGPDPTNGPENEFQSKTPRSTGMSELRGCNVGCGNSPEFGGVPWGRDRSRPSDGGIGFVPECASEEIAGRRRRLEGDDGETHCESFRLRIPCTGT